MVQPMHTGKREAAPGAAAKAWRAGAIVRLPNTIQNEVLTERAILANLLILQKVKWYESFQIATWRCRIEENLSACILIFARVVAGKPQDMGSDASLFLFFTKTEKTAQPGQESGFRKATRWRTD